MDVFAGSGGGKAARAFSSGDEIPFGRSWGGEVEALICDSSDGEEASSLGRSLETLSLFTFSPFSFSPASSCFLRALAGALYPVDLPLRYSS